MWVSRFVDGFGLVRRVFGLLGQLKCIFEISPDGLFGWREISEDTFAGGGRVSRGMCMLGLSRRDAEL